MKYRLILMLLVFSLAALACSLPEVDILPGFTATQTPWPIPDPPDESLLGTTVRDLTYCTIAGMDLKLDAYFPSIAESAVPVLVFIHGGSWKAGDKSVGLEENFRQMLNEDYLVISLNYRLLPDHPFPAPIDDVMCAIRHLRVEAANYGLDPNRIAVMGASAGGHLAAMIGLAGPGDGLGLSGPYQGVSSEVQAVIMLAGPSDLTAWTVGEVGTLPIDSPQGVDPLAWINPVSYIHAGAPPFLLIHGDRDNVVPVSQSENFYQLLTADGVIAQLQVVENADHALMNSGGSMDPSRLELATMMVRFLSQYVK